MKTILLLLRNPLIKIIGAGLIIYFGLMHNKSDQSTLGYRLSKENVSKNYYEAKEKGEYIISTIRDVQNVQAGNMPAEVLKDKVSDKIVIENLDTLKIQDLTEGVGELKVNCGDQAKIYYEIYIKENNLKLDFATIVVTVGSKKNKLFEQKIIGMKKDGVRIINIPKHFEAIDTKLASLLRFNETDLFYKVTLLEFTKSLEEIKCN